MTVRKPGGLSRVRFLAAALLLAIGMPLAQPPSAVALSCSGAHEITLDSASITPATGTISTLFTFGIRYRDTGNCTPHAVNLRIPELGYFPMTQGSGRTFRQGVQYSVTLNLPAGRWGYWFVAASGSGRGDRTETLKIAKAVTVAAEPTPVPPPAPVLPPAPPAPGEVIPPASIEPAPATSAGPAPTIDPSDGRVPPGRRERSGFDFQIPALFAGPVGGVVGPWMALTGIGIAIFWLLLRRRPESPMGAGAAAVPSGGLGLPGAARDDATIPRWLRPSLQAARQAGWGVPPPRSAVRFLGPAAPGVDRREIGYRLVRVADGPDDLKSEEVGRFDRGDQVEILENKGSFVRVRGADGLEGWVHQAAIVSILD
ncbi:MAG: SH3 domain-containing protein [Chloroflexota bacterium]|nr:SH3 domain-containing protein [Chloroflexota bacterium]